VTPARASTSAAITKRQLNRALLARQMLLERQKATPLAAIERLVGMQAQIPRPPFGGLWTRLDNFERDDLLRLLREKKVLRATAMRATIHLLTASDYCLLRPALAEMLAGGASSVVGKRLAGSPTREELLDLGRDFFGNTPGPFEEFRSLLKRTYPTGDERAMAYAVRLGLPLAMLPSDVTWGFPANAGFCLAEKWLGRKIPVESPPPEKIALRYLAAFGPATPADAQTWSGMRAWRQVFERLRPSLVTFTDEKKRELFDLPDAPRPDEDTPAPIRFLPEYDNVLLGHADRARIISDQDRKRILTANLIVIGSFLVDGFVAGGWKVADKKKTAVLTLTAFTKLTKKTVSQLEEEGVAMVRFYFPEAKAVSVAVAR
jgi:hypothetical protein